MKSSIINQIVIFVLNFVVRMIFVRILSAEYLGVNGLFNNIITVLSFAELGIGSAIVFSMYEPLLNNDMHMLNGLMNLYKRAYWIIGLVIIVVGSSLTPFLKYFIKELPQIDHLSIIYLLFVFSSGITYLFSYFQSYLIADQKNYIVIRYRIKFNIISSIFQIVVLLAFRNFIFYLMIKLGVPILEQLLISRKTLKIYPHLQQKDKFELKATDKRRIYKNIRAMFLHKTGGIVVSGTDNLLISKFVGIVQVGLYSNYLLIITSFNKIYNIFSSSITASIGNLGATKDTERLLFIYQCLDMIGYWFFGFSSIFLALLFNPLIELLFGAHYLLEPQTVSLIIISYYLTGRRRAVLNFREALGLFWYDRYKPIFESTVNIVVSVFLAIRMGVDGVILGTIISTVVVSFWVEPIVLYKYGFSRSSREYFIRYFIEIIAVAIIGFGLVFITSRFNLNQIATLLIRTGLGLVVPSICIFLVYRRTKEFAFIMPIFKKLFRKTNR